jgi:alanine dehydrogenase
MVLVLSRNDVEELLRMDDTIRSCEDAFRQFGEGKVQMPLRLVMRVEQPTGVITVMPAHLLESKAIGVKLVSYFPQNRERALPGINAVVLYCDHDTGRVLAIMDGTHMTAVRTAAVSAVATKYLAREDSRKLAIIGSGPQARTHLEAMRCVRPIESANVYSPTPAHRAQFAESMSRKHGIPVNPADTPEKAVEEADIIVTASAARQPVLKGEWLKPGVHINAVGSGIPDLRELDDRVLQLSKIVADDIDAAVKETGDFITPTREGKFKREQIYAGLGEVVTGRKEGRTSREEITLFKSVGLALEDAATAKLVYELALSRKVGKEVLL